jgi:sterol desaturase/sphingolipid hydroxylase (fatty acid hydroxylase superfamily)
VNASQYFSALLPILIVMSLASIIELLMPLRQQSRRIHGRLVTNLTLIIFNLCIGVAINVVLLGGALYLSERGWGLLPLLNVTGVAAAIISIVVLDFAAYAAHVSLHKFPFLWKVHLVHHSDVTVDATTSYRHHPIEPVYRLGVTAIIAWSLGVPLVALALYRTMSAINAIFEHANLRIPQLLDRLLIWFWVTPDMHKVHHSNVRSQTDSNYANLFSFYDRIFRTFTPTSVVPALDYGIDGYRHANQQTLSALMRLPFIATKASPSADVSASSATAVASK